MGWVICQPGDDEASHSAMVDEDAGGPCHFELAVNGHLRLYPIAFGCRRCVGNEVHFHSHPGEATAAAYAMSKNRYLLWGRPFTLITDCYALLWILQYQEDNPALRRLQLGLLGLWFTVVHRANKLNADPDYWSRIGQDIHFDPLLGKYQLYCRLMEEKHGPSRSEVIGRDQAPGRRRRAARDISLGPESIPIEDHPTHLHDTSSDHPIVSFVHIPVVFESEDKQRPPSLSASHHRDVGSAALKLSRFSWLLYGFGSGHFFSSIRQLSLPFHVPMAVDTTMLGRTMLKDVGNVATILDSSVSLRKTLLDPNVSGQTFHGYYITCPFIKEYKEQRRFLVLQHELISLLDTKFNLQTLIV